MASRAIPVSESKEADHTIGKCEDGRPEDGIRVEGSPFFDCEKEEEAHSRDGFVRCQEDAGSKFMEHVRKEMEKEGSKYVKKEGLIYLKEQSGSFDRVVIPENLRAWILRMHHRIELEGHQGHKRL
jgi:hypothetical protein